MFEKIKSILSITILFLTVIFLCILLFSGVMFVDAFEYQNQKEEIMTLKSTIDTLESEKKTLQYNLDNEGFEDK